MIKNTQIFKIQICNFVYVLYIAYIYYIVIIFKITRPLSCMKFSNFIHIDTAEFPNAHEEELDNFRISCIPKIILAI